jgi:hypothetical protein
MRPQTVTNLGAAAVLSYPANTYLGVTITHISARYLAAPTNGQLIVSENGVARYIFDFVGTEVFTFDGEMNLTAGTLVEVTLASGGVAVSSRLSVVSGYGKPNMGA